MDACLTGVGAHDGQVAYAARIAPDDDPVANITEIEAVNIVIALHTFVTDDDAGGHIMVHCDNLPSVQALTSGRAQNTVLAECARAIWMLQARYAIKISYSHIAGQDNQIADALSRAHTSKAYYRLADNFIRNLELIIVHPCTHILSNLYPPVLSRSGLELAGGPSGGVTGTGPCAWNKGSITLNSSRAARILPQVQRRPHGHDRGSSVPVGGIPGEPGDCSGYHQEQSLTRPGLYEVGQGVSHRLQPCARREGAGRSSEAQGLCLSQEGRHTAHHAESCSTDNE